MKIATTILMTILLSFATGLYLPWWSFALVTFLVALFMYQRPGMAYILGFVSILLFWGLLAWWIDAQNDSILSKRMANIFPLGGSSFLLILITALVGAIIGGLAALSGSFLRKYLDANKPVGPVS